MEGSSLDPVLTAHAPSAAPCDWVIRALLSRRPCKECCLATVATLPASYSHSYSIPYPLWLSC